MSLSLRRQMEVAEYVATTTGSKFPPVETDDVYGELLLFLVLHRERLATMDAALLQYALRQEAVTYCRNERAERTHTSDFYYYLPDDVRDSLTYFFDKRIWETYEGSASDVQIYGNDAGTDDGLVALADVSRAYDRLQPAEREALYWHYGPSLESSTPAERTKAARAVTALTKLMNGELRGKADNGGPGTRTVHPNSWGIAVAHQDYNGELRGHGGVDHL